MLQITTVYARGTMSWIDVLSIKLLGMSLIDSIHHLWSSKRTRSMIKCTKE